MNEKIGERIKHIRKELGLTQEEFGTRIGVKGNTVTGYERGTRNPSDAIINIICLVFRVDQTWLRTGEGDDIFLVESNLTNPLEKIYSDFDCNALERKFLDSYFSLKKQERYSFCSMLKNMFPSLSEMIGSDPLAPTRLNTSKDSANSSREEEGQVAELLQKSPTELSESEIETLTNEFHRELTEEKEAPAKSSVSSKFTGSNIEKGKAI